MQKIDQSLNRHDFNWKTSNSDLQKSSYQDLDDDLLFLESEFSYLENKIDITDSINVYYEYQDRNHYRYRTCG